MQTIFADLLKIITIVIVMISFIPRVFLSFVPYNMSRFCAQVVELALKPFS